jgi:hypothetical protein
MASIVDPIYIGINDERIELVGAELEQFLSDRKAQADAQLALQALAVEKKLLRKTVIEKLLALGLTELEISSLIPLEAEYDRQAEESTPIVLAE